jgi:putative ABC transport system ATP-binding protein
VERSFQVGSQTIRAVHDLDLEVYRGEVVAIRGRSGSGKTTLLNLLAGLDTPTGGRVLFRGQDLADLSDGEMTEVRRRQIGFIFQSFGLLPLLSAYENVELPMRLAGMSRREREERTRYYLNLVGLEGRLHHRPYELSGGEQQRVAIARAIAHNPPLVLADEPTGELDSPTAQAIFSLFRLIARRQEITIIVTTHDETLLAMADRVLELRDGTFDREPEPGVV